MFDMEWRPGVALKLGYYVYLLIDPDTGRVFYVGKGTGNRCFSHLHEARMTAQDSTEEYEKLATIRRIQESGHDVRIEILRHGLTENEALHLEAATMDILGFSDLTNRVVGVGTREIGRMHVDDVNAQYGAQPVEFDPDHRLILIRSRRFTHGMDEQALYDTTRMWWKLGDRRKDADFALAVHGGVVRAVYKIDGWIEPTETDIAEAPNRLGRFGFIGHRDEDMERRYVFADVTGYLPERGGRNPISYINC